MPLLEVLVNYQFIYIDVNPATQLSMANLCRILWWGMRETASSVTCPTVQFYAELLSPPCTEDTHTCHIPRVLWNLKWDLQLVLTGPHALHHTTGSGAYNCSSATKSKGEYISYCSAQRQLCFWWGTVRIQHGSIIMHICSPLAHICFIQTPMTI